MKKLLGGIAILALLSGCTSGAEIIQGQGQSSTDRTAIRIVGFGMGGWVISVKGLDVDRQEQQQEVHAEAPYKDNIQLADW